MCNYCKGEVMERENLMLIKDEENEDLVLYIDDESNLCLGSIDGIYPSLFAEETLIKFCPMCGREL